MRPVELLMSAAGNSPWADTDYIESWYGVGLFLLFSEDANLTATAQYTPDGHTPHPVKISRTTTVATVTDLGPISPQTNLPRGVHLLLAGDDITIAGSGSANFDGEFPVASAPSPTTYTYTVANSGATSDGSQTTVVSRRVINHAILAGISGTPPARTPSNFAFPVRAVRLNVTSYVAGWASLVILQGSGAR